MLVEALLLGGVPDPTIHINSTATELAAPFFSSGSLSAGGCASNVIGFSGWRLMPSGTIVSGEAHLDRLIFGQPDFIALPEQVRMHIVEQAAKLPKCAGQSRIHHTNNADCKADAPLRGPDDPTQVHYDPSVDDSGCFETMQFDNNCYNYGNDGTAYQHRSPSLTPQPLMSPSFVRFSVRRQC